MDITRRRFSTLAASLAFAGLAQQQAFAGRALIDRGTRASATPVDDGFGPLIADPEGLIDLPADFGYRVISAFGTRMDDGFTVPDAADGMGCFDLGGGRVALVRNHELTPRQLDRGAYPADPAPSLNSYDTRPNGVPLPGGTSTIVYHPASGKVEREFMSLAGTIRNCAGGVTPWGSWLTCEEDVTRAGAGVAKDHGWVFEIPATASGLVDPVPLTALGRFNHEAAAVDPDTGIVYLTEDRSDSLFYRFIPNRYGKLSDGGRLQALSFSAGAQQAHQDSRNHDRRGWSVGDWLETVWIDLEDTDSPKDDLRGRGHQRGATLFARGEGIHWGNRELYFCCTSGGGEKLGQIMRYRPSPLEGTDQEAQTPGKLQLFLESTDPDQFNFGDNLTVTPGGHLLVCEDRYTRAPTNYIRGVTPQGSVYDFARIRLTTEPAGGCFSPDGMTFFVNLYHPTRTLAITGPWHRAFGPV